MSPSTPLRSSMVPPTPTRYGGSPFSRSPPFQDDVNLPSIVTPFNIEGIDDRYQRTMAQASTAWQERIIPRLIPVFIKIIHSTRGFQRLQELPIPGRRVCRCGKTRLCKVSVCRMNGMSFVSEAFALANLTAEIYDIQIDACDCVPAAQQLLEAGLFPSAPLHPSFAVELHVLELTREVFLRTSPNNTAWTAALEAFLQNLGFQLDHEGTLRRSFASALEWYSHLRNVVDEHVDVLQEKVRRDVVGDAVLNSTATPPQMGTRKRDHKRPLEKENPFATPIRRTRASEYLRRRCPACFGDMKHDRDSTADVCVCTDACFTQKREAGNMDPPKIHPHSVFISAGTCEEMEAYVDEVRGSRPLPGRPAPKKRRGARVKATVAVEEEEEDHIEYEALQVPKSVLDGCEDSFKAADESRMRSDSDRFDDTGLMALLCRHDRVLWMANMKSKGEKQFYTLALLETLFQDLPEDIVVAILYDIACQLHRSVLKWGFLAPFIKRMVFAVAVFHAFVHRLECQLRYHPRKREGLGFTSGEGCERLWHLISRLISSLRKSGFHHRLYTLNTQLRFIDENNLFALGAWMARRQAFCDNKQASAEAILAEMAKRGYSRADLAQQWDLQVKTQTKPQPSRSKHLGVQAVNEVLALRGEKKAAKDRVCEAEQTWKDATGADDSARLNARSALLEARLDLETVTENLAKREAALGVDGQARLEKAQKSKFFEYRMNVLALKTLILSLLRSRNLELSELKRSGHRQQGSNGMISILSTVRMSLIHGIEWKLRSAISTSVRNRLPRIRRLITEYNKLCLKLADLAIHRQAPKGAKIPATIDLKAIPTLDVDDSIWDDAGLTDADQGTTPPPWLVDDSVKRGIRALLDEKRAEEEGRFLRNERRSMKAWFQEEWLVVNRALESAGEFLLLQRLTNLTTTDCDALQFQFQIRRTRLVALCAVWQSSLPAGDFVTRWGPSDVELAEVDVKKHQRQRNGDIVDVNPFSAPLEIVAEEDDGLAWDLFDI
ncbi:unnamed protein product [Mycena citricolor]|uniref:CxC1-like cysteine cluster associated with KDZ transposases domain-containing protein n=1 Tax=Mycena citricolor TaxID=2018698 RepID=A0AAD2HZX9_9AGAR|nr:unnamed protein product [Mycena citricolor]